MRPKPQTHAHYTRETRYIGQLNILSTVSVFILVLFLHILLFWKLSNDSPQVKLPITPPQAGSSAIEGQLISPPLLPNAVVPQEISTPLLKTPVDEASVPVVEKPVPEKKPVPVVEPKPIKPPQPIHRPLQPQLTLKRTDKKLVTAKSTQPQSAPAPQATQAPQSAIQSQKVIRQEDPAPIQAPRIDASAGNNPVPAYPRASRIRNEQGTVMLAVTIAANGDITAISIARSSGYPRLDEAALNAVRHWHYHPAQQGGKAISYRYLQPINFNLNN